MLPRVFLMTPKLPVPWMVTPTLRVLQIALLCEVEVLECRKVYAVDSGTVRRITA
jgi:hypothetical protein